MIFAQREWNNEEWVSLNGFWFASFILLRGSAAAQVVARFVFCLNIKSWRTTVTLDSSTVILHLLYKSECGGKALAGFLKLLTDVPISILCCRHKIKESKHPTRGGCFCFSGAACHTLQMHIWEPGSVAAVARVLVKSGSGSQTDGCVHPIGSAV